MAAVMSKTLHRTRIRCMVLSVIEAYDHFIVGYAASVNSSGFNDLCLVTQGTDWKVIPWQEDANWEVTI